MTTSEIKAIQSSLKIFETGDYDEFTEAAVRNFQLKNGLPATGILDNPTKELLIKDSKLGLVSTDLSESPTIKKYLLKSDEYFKGPTPKQSIFLHFTAGWDNPYNVVKDWENDARDKIGTQFVVGGVNCQTLTDQWDGEIVQCFPDSGCYGWHLGIGNTEVHRNSVGIEMCSFGPLKLVGRDYLNWAGKAVNPKLVVDLKRDFRGVRYFQRITDAQLKSVKFLIEKLGNEHSIDVREGLQKFIKSSKDVFDAFDFKKDVKDGKLKGLFCHTNVSGKNKWGNYEKWDLFPQPEVIDMLLSI